MANGDAALAAGMDIIDSLTTDARLLGDEVNLTRDYIAERTASVTPIASGGTGASTAAAARSNLGIQSTVTAVNNASPTASEGVLLQGGAGGRINVGAPTSGGNAATKSYVDDGLSQKAERDSVLNVRAGEMSSAVWNRDLTSTRRSVWMSSPSGGFIDLGYASSSRRYKENIESFDTPDEAVLDARLVEFDRKNGGHHEVGMIAEELEEAGFGWCVFRDEDGEVEGIEYSMLGAALFPVVQRLIRRVDELERSADR